MNHEMIKSPTVNDSTDGVNITDQETDVLCPVCLDSNLCVGILNGTLACACPECQGFLIDGPSLAMLVQGLRASYRGADDTPELLDPKELDQKMNCPACFETMYTHPYHGPGNVVINSCSHCQLNWFDPGELAKIVRAPGRRG